LVSKMVIPLECMDWSLITTSKFKAEQCKYSSEKLVFLMECLCCEGEGRRASFTEEMQSIFEVLELMYQRRFILRKCEAFSKFLELT